MKSIQRNIFSSKPNAESSHAKMIAFCAVIILGVLSRLIPHLPNWTALGALALFSGSLMKPFWKALLIPMIVLLISDLFFGFHNTMFGTYLGFALLTLVGHFVLKRRTVKRVAIASTSGSLIFFFVTNFVVWIMSGLYSLDGEGLAKCFEMAIPFWSNQFFGDLTYSFGIFGFWRLFEKFVLLKGALKDSFPFPI